MKKIKGCQLRVRITDEAKSKLEEITDQRGLGESISDLVRTGINQIVSAPNGMPPLLTEGAWKSLCALSKETDRPVGQIIGECVEAIVEMVGGNDRTPLIVEEIKLRRRYSGEGPTTQRSRSTRRATK